MRSSMLVALGLVVTVAGCGAVSQSRLNPMNWFGPSQRNAAVVASNPQIALDGGRLQVTEVTELHVEPSRGGAIVRAVGLPATQGWYRAELLAQEGGREDALVFRFVLKPPPAGATRVGTPLSREVTVGKFLTDAQLQGIRTITVTGDGNSRSVNRR